MPLPFHQQNHLNNNNVNVNNNNNSSNAPVNNNNNNNNSGVVNRVSVGPTARPPSMGLRASALKTGADMPPTSSAAAAAAAAAASRTTFVTKLELEVAHERTRSDPTNDPLWGLVATNGKNP